MSEKHIIHVSEWKFTYEPFENKHSFDDGAVKPLEIVLQRWKFKGLFFILKDIEKSINLEVHFAQLSKNKDKIIFIGTLRFLYLQCS